MPHHRFDRSTTCLETDGTAHLTSGPDAHWCIYSHPRRLSADLPTLCIRRSRHGRTYDTMYIHTLYHVGETVGIFSDGASLPTPHPASVRDSTTSVGRSRRAQASSSAKAHDDNFFIRTPRDIPVGILVYSRKHLPLFLFCRRSAGGHTDISSPYDSGPLCLSLSETSSLHSMLIPTSYVLQWFVLLLPSGGV